MKISRNKIKLFYMDRQDLLGERLTEILGCKLGALPIRYLGLPFTDRQLRKKDWWPVIGKFEKRFEGWQAKLLS